MLWYRHRQVPGRQNRLPLADSGGAHVSKEPRCGKDGPRAADMAVRQWRPVEQALQGSKDVGLRARARSKSFLCKSS